MQSKSYDAKPPLSYQKRLVQAYVFIWFQMLCWELKFDVKSRATLTDMQGPWYCKECLEARVQSEVQRVENDNANARSQSSRGRKPGRAVDGRRSSGRPADIPKSWGKASAPRPSKGQYDTPPSAAPRTSKSYPSSFHIHTSIHFQSFQIWERPHKNDKVYVHPIPCRILECGPFFWNLHKRLQKLQKRMNSIRSCCKNQSSIDFTFHQASLSDYTCRLPQPKWGSPRAGWCATLTNTSGFSTLRSPMVSR